MKSRNGIDRLALLPALLLLALAVITFIDVVGRNLLAMPLTGSFDIISYMMAVLVFAAAPAVTRSRSHVVVDLLDPFCPTWLARARSAAIELLSAGILFLIAWRLALYGIEAYAFDRVSPDIYLPIWPIASFCAFVAGVTGFIHLANATRDILREPEQ